MSLQRRSWLFVSGSRPEQFAKAVASQADAVIFDLEDSVPAGAKEQARDNVVEFLSDNANSRMFVRVNATTSGTGREDLLALAPLRIGGVRLPKVEDAEQVRTAARLLGGSPRLIQATVESARGVRALREIASAPEVGQICLGEGDLSADLRLGSRDWLLPVRMEVVVQSRAADLPGPVQSPHPAVRDLDGLAESTRIGRSMGFSGRSAIHPAQVQVINTIHLPTDDEVRRARDTLRVLETTATHGQAAATADDGRFVDLSTAREAQRILTLHAATSEVEPGARYPDLNDEISEKLEVTDYKERQRQ